MLSSALQLARLSRLSFCSGTRPTQHSAPEKDRPSCILSAMQSRGKSPSTSARGLPRAPHRPRRSCVAAARPPPAMQRILTRCLQRVVAVRPAAQFKSQRRAWSHGRLDGHNHPHLFPCTSPHPFPSLQTPLRLHRLVAPATPSHGVCCLLPGAAARGPRARHLHPPPGRGRAGGDGR